MGKTTGNQLLAHLTPEAIVTPHAEPPLAQPGAWAGVWRRLAVKAALAAQEM